MFFSISFIKFYVKVLISYFLLLKNKLLWINISKMYLINKQRDWIQSDWATKVSIVFPFLWVFTIKPLRCSYFRFNLVFFQFASFLFPLIYSEDFLLVFLNSFGFFPSHLEILFLWEWNTFLLNYNQIWLLDRKSVLHVETDNQHSTLVNGFDINTIQIII